MPVSSTPKRRSANLLLKNRQTLARPQPEPDTAAEAPGLRDWIGVLAIGTGLFMAIMDVQIVTSSLTQIQKQLGAERTVALLNEAGGLQAGLPLSAVSRPSDDLTAEFVPLRPLLLAWPVAGSGGLPTFGASSLSKAWKRGFKA